MEVSTLIFLIAGAGVAGWVDAVIGGGGLILIPLILMAFPQLAPATALGTNKVAGVLGTFSAAITMTRKLRPPLKMMVTFVPVALIAAGCGALAATALKEEYMRPIIIVLMVAVGIFVALRPNFGSGDSEAIVTPVRMVLAVCAVVAIAFYDGIFGPGTGMFLIMALTAIFSQSFLSSAVMAKVVNVATNLGALIVFLIGGHVWITLGLALAVANVIGAQIGARTVLGGGAKLVRGAVLVLVVVMASYLSYQQFLA